LEIEPNNRNALKLHVSIDSYSKFEIRCMYMCPTFDFSNWKFETEPFDTILKYKNWRGSGLNNKASPRLSGSGYILSLDQMTIFFFFSYACRNPKTLTTCNVRPYIYIYICWTTSKRKAAETLDMKNVEPKFWNLARKASWKVKQFDRFMGRVEFWHKIMGFDRVALFE